MQHKKYFSVLLHSNSSTICEVFKLLTERGLKQRQLDGIVKKYYKNGKLAYEWSYKDGTQEGVATSYFKSGSLSTEWNYKGGRLDGITRIYYKSGGIKYIDTYRDGHKINRKAYDSKGKLEFDQDYPTEK